ncbi:MAG: ATP-binding cassette domain-containing protein [Propionibacteriaceae bacterium]
MNGTVRSTEHVPEAKHRLEVLLKCLKLAFSASSGLFVATALLGLACAALPLIQFLLVSALAGSLQIETSTTAQLSIVIFLAIIVGVSFSLMEITSHVKASLLQRCAAYGYHRLYVAEAALSMRDVSDPTFDNKLLQARHALNHGSLTQYIDSLFSVAMSVISAVSMACAMWRISPWASLFVLLSLLPIFLEYCRISHLLMEQWETNSHHIQAGYYFEGLLSAKSSLRELSALDARNKIMQLGTRHRAEAARLDNMVERKAILAELVGGVGSTVFVALAVFSIYRFSKDPKIDLLASVFALASAVGAVRSVGFAIGMLFVDRVKIEKFLNFIDPANVSPTIVPCDLVPTTLEIRNLTFTYPGSLTPTLHNVSLSACKGEVCAIVGANGCGKSTFLSCLLGIYPIDSGTILLDDQDFTGRMLEDHANVFSYLPQELAHFNMSVMDNLLLGITQKETSPGELAEALQFSGLDALIHPNSTVPVDELVGEELGGHGLSGGQWQRLALSRLQLRNAPILILDEPTSAIDAQSEEMIFENLRRTAASRITMLVSHRASTLQHVDRIYVMDAGQIVQSGSFPELVEQPGPFRTLFRSQLLS